MVKASSPRTLALDTETTGLSPRHGARAYAVSGCDAHGKSYFWDWPVDPVTRKPKIKANDQQIKEIKTTLSRYDQFVFHHSKFDIRHLVAIGVLPPHVPNEFWANVHDTLPMSHVLSSNESHELKDLGLKYLDILDDDERAIENQCKAFRQQKAIPDHYNLNFKDGKDGKQGEWIWKTDSWLLKALNPKSKVLETYARLDAERTIRLFLLFREMLASDGLEALYERERKLLQHVYNMEEEGLPIHLPSMHSELTKFTHRAGYHEARVKSAAASKGLTDFNPGSPKQLNTILYQKYRFPGIKQTKKSDPDNPSYSTDADTLEELHAHHARTPEKKTFLSNLLSYRSANTATKYLIQYRRLAVKYETDARKKDFYYAILHGSANQNGTDTTRFSMSDPNAQNISDKEEMNLRAIFGPLPGFFWLDYDYSNIELRLFSWLSEEKPLIEAFYTGVSVHCIICETLHGPSMFKNPKWKEDPRYGAAKNGTFAIIYGAGEARADATYGVDGAYQKIRKMFPGLVRLSQSCMDEARKKGYVETLFGYRLYCPKDRAYAALNYKIQGTAGDVIKYGMINVAETVPRNQASMVLTVHDELIFKVPDTYKKPITLKPLADTLAKCMESPGDRIGIPTPVSRSIITTNWSERTELVA